MTALDARPWTDDERRAAAREIYGRDPVSDEVHRRNRVLHRTATQRAIEDAERQRQIEHEGYITYGLARMEQLSAAYPAHAGWTPPAEWLNEVYDLLACLTLAASDTEARHAAVMAAAMKKLNSLETA